MSFRTDTIPSLVQIKTRNLLSQSSKEDNKKNKLSKPQNDRSNQIQARQQIHEPKWIKSPKICHRLTES
uniref:Uncharacterized protein n=1 Tax=Nelumbo nucifera TaxID=4432 RepID=A0A822YUZ6_NELNU|nr:TPA_asm: hypothetical protein HUJ06_007018 [Nelumbo nucifera]